MRIFYDVDTQNDFMNQNGALYVPDAELVKTNLKLLTDYAKKNKVPVLGSMDKHFGTPEYKERELELARWGGLFPDHCMVETPGQLKIPETVLSDYPVLIEHPLDNKILNKLLERATDELDQVYAEYWLPNGIYFEKQSYDVFTNPNVKAFLEIAKPESAVVYGVATDFCVKAAVLGLQKMKIQCYVVTDAIKGVFPKSTKSALEEMTNARAKFVTTKEVLENKTW